MATQIVRPEPASTERIRRRLRPVKHAPPNREALAGVREGGRRSATVEDAIAAVASINPAWSRVSLATHDAIALLLTVLELSDSIIDALAVFSNLVADYPIASNTLDTAKAYLNSHYPGAELRIEADDNYYGVTKAWLYVFVPADDYPSFKERHDRLTDWWLENFPDMGGIIDITPRAMAQDV